MTPPRLLNEEHMHEIAHGMWPTTSSSSLQTATACLSSALPISRLQFNAHQLQGPILLDKHGNHVHNFQLQPPFLVMGSLIYLRQQSIFKFFNEWDGRRKGESVNVFS